MKLQVARCKLQVRKWARGMALVVLFATCNVQLATSSYAAEHAETLKRVQDYLNGITTLASDFTQIAPNGDLTGGKFFLQRPGKMRWQYSPPTPILMVANGGQMVYYDYELEQLTYIPLDSNLGTFLAQEKIDLSDKFVTISKFQEEASMIRLTLTQTNKPEAGSLTLEFSDSPLAIRNMVITDTGNQVTTVSFNNARFGEPLDNKLFVFTDPRKGNKNIKR